MKAEKDVNRSKREFVTMLKVAGIVAIVLSLAAAIMAAAEIRGAGFDSAIPLVSLTLQLFFAGIMMLAASVGLDMLIGLRETMSDDSIEPRRYGRTRSNKGSLLASKLAAEPAAH